MTWNKEINIHLDVDRVGQRDNPLLSVSADSVSAAARGPAFVRGDVVMLNIHLRRFLDGVWTRIELPAGRALVFAGKLKSALDSDLLFLADSFALVPGDNPYYTGQLDLHTTELETALAATDSVDLLCDIEIQNSDNTSRATLQFEASARQQVYTGEEGVPTTAEPPYPPAENIMLKLRGTHAIDSGLSSGTISIASLGLEAAPSQVLVAIEKPSSAAANIFATLADITSAAFAYSLSAATTAAGYKLHWLVIP